MVPAGLFNESVGGLDKDMGEYAHPIRIFKQSESEGLVRKILHLITRLMEDEGGINMHKTRHSTFRFRSIYIWHATSIVTGGVLLLVYHGVKIQRDSLDSEGTSYGGARV